MSENSQEPTRPSFLRHLAIMFYDTLILLSLLFLASFIAVVFNDNQAISQGNIFFILYLFTVSFLFYGWFWTHGGQTIGMRAWKVRLVNKQLKTISWKQSGFRFIAAIISWLPLGLGYWWQWIGLNKQSWLDSISETKLIYDKNMNLIPLSRLS